MLQAVLFILGYIFLANKQSTFCEYYMRFLYLMVSITYSENSTKENLIRQLKNGVRLTFDDNRFSNYRIFIRKYIKTMQWFYFIYLFSLFFIYLFIL